MVYGSKSRQYLKYQDSHDQKTKRSLSFIFSILNSYFLGNQLKIYTSLSLAFCVENAYFYYTFLTLTKTVVIIVSQSFIDVTHLEVKVFSRSAIFLPP